MEKDKHFIKVEIHTQVLYHLRKLVKENKFGDLKKIASFPTYYLIY